LHAANPLFKPSQAEVRRKSGSGASFDAAIAARRVAPDLEVTIEPA
jgi:hypothetical protein